MTEELKDAIKRARSYSALDTPSGVFLGALENGSGGMNYYYFQDGEYRYENDSVRRRRERRKKEDERRKAERKTERKKALEKERKLYG